MGRKIIYDRSEIKGPRKTSQGFLKVPGFATRVGVFKYQTADGKTYGQLRHPDHVFDEESMDSLRGAPVTLHHPDEFVTPFNAKKVMRGYTSDNVEKQDKYLKTDLTITDEEAIKSVEEKKVQELSCGYTCDLVEESGVYDGEKYDFVQKNIRYNHLALVDKGRAGPHVRVHMDSADDQVFIHITDQTKGEPTMVKVMIGGKEYEVSPEVKAAIEAHMASMQKESDGNKAIAEDAKTKLSTTKAELDRVQATADSFKEKVTSLEKKITDGSDEEKIRKAARTRVELLKVSDSLGVKDSEKLNDRELKVACIKIEQKNFDSTDKSDDYVNVFFDIMRKDLQEKQSKHPLQSYANKIVNADANNVIDASKAREKSINESAEAWKQPLSIGIK